MDYMFDVLNMTHYSFKVCEMLIYQKYLNEACNCFDSNIGSINWKKQIFSQEYSSELLEKNCRNRLHIECTNAFNANFTAQPQYYIGNSCPKGIILIHFIFE